MKITLIHGQSHKGSTYHVARILAEKIDGEITEIVLPRDFDQMCVGCAQCIKKDEKLCPHYEKLAPITEAIDAADLLIFESPVYVYHVTSAMKALLEHYGDVLFMTGDVDGALEYWNDALEKGSDSKMLPQKIKDKKYYEE